MSFRVFLRLSLSLFLFYTILRLDFWFWNRSLFSEETFFTLAKAFFLGLRFDAVAVSWSLLPLLIWGWVFRRAYWIPLFLMIVPLYFLNFTDIELWSFFGRRLSLSTLLLFSEAQGKAGAMASQYLGWIAVGFVTLLPAFYCLWVSSFNAEKLKVNLRGGKFWAEQLVLVILLVIGSRGGLQHKPISPITAQLFDKSHLNLLALNSTFTLGKSLKGSSLNKERHFQNPEQALALVNSAVDSKPVAFSFSRPQNVVLLIVESLSWEYIEGGHTPFLSDLMKRSLTFSRAMANGRRSIEGVAALLSGVPSLMEEPFITSEFSTNQIVGLASVFQKNGYRNFFYHGGENGTMHFDSFAQKAGFEFYYGARQYPHPEDHDGVWGIWDRPYLQHFAQDLEIKDQPFLATLFTLSSHQPFHLPPQEQVQFPEGAHPILKTIRYTDSALKEFFSAVEKREWYQNTLFVIVADHTGPQVTTSLKDPMAAYRIPILFFHPQISNWPQEIDRQQLAQQIDISGSLYDLLQLKGASTTALSRSVFRHGPKHFTAYSSGVYWHTDGVTLLTRQNRRNRFTDFSDAQKVVTEVPILELQLKAVQDVFSWGLWDNALYGPK